MLKKKVCTALWQAMQDPNSEDLYEVGLSLGRVRFWADRILCSHPRPSVGMVLGVYSHMRCLL